LITFQIELVKCWIKLYGNIFWLKISLQTPNIDSLSTIAFIHCFYQMIRHNYHKNLWLNRDYKKTSSIHFRNNLYIWLSLKTYKLTNGHQWIYYNLCDNCNDSLDFNSAILPKNVVWATREEFHDLYLCIFYREFISMENTMKM